MKIATSYFLMNIGWTLGKTEEVNIIVIGMHYDVLLLTVFVLLAEIIRIYSMSTRNRALKYRILTIMCTRTILSLMSRPSF